MQFIGSRSSKMQCSPKRHTKATCVYQCSALRQCMGAARQRVPCCHCGWHTLSKGNRNVKAEAARKSHHNKTHMALELMEDMLKEGLLDDMLGKFLMDDMLNKRLLDDMLGKHVMDDILKMHLMNKFLGDVKVKTFKLSSDRSCSAASVAEAARAAEAAQEALTRRGLLAEQMQRNELLRSIMTTYQTVQQLYHKAIIAQLKQHAELATCPAGLAYALYCTVLKLTPKKAANSKNAAITSSELERLQKQKLQAPADPAKQPVAQLAHAISLCVQQNKELTSVDVFVMPDIITLLASGWTGAFSSAQEQDETANKPQSHIPCSEPSTVSAGKPLEGKATTHATRKCQQYLLQVCQPSASPPNSTLAYEHLPVMSRPLLLKQLGSVVDAALSTLEPGDDIAAVGQATAEYSTWGMRAHTNPMKTLNWSPTIGTMPLWLAQTCMFGGMSALLHDTAMEQLSGQRSVGDWSPVTKVLSSFQLQHSESLSGWLASEGRLLELLSKVIDPGWTCPWRMADLAKMNQQSLKAGQAGGLPGLSATTTLQEYTHLVFYPDQQSLKALVANPDYQFNCMAIQIMYMSLELTGLLELVDNEHCCWSFSWYWQDVVDLALKAAGGQPGPAAVAAAQQLMKEKHSISVARYALRWADTLSPSFPDRVITNNLISTAPLQLDTDFHRAIIARGIQEEPAMWSAVNEPEGSVETSPDVYAEASSMFDSSPEVASIPKTFLQHMESLLLTEPESAQAVMNQTIKLFTTGGVQCKVTADEALAIDPVLSSTLGSWLVLLWLRRQPDYFGTPADLVWMAVALAQWRILHLASSSETAVRLSSAGAVPEQFLRPTIAYLASRSATAAALAELICVLRWRINGTAATAVLHSEVITLAPSSQAKIHALMWLAVAANAHPDQDTTAAAITIELEGAINVYRTSSKAQHRANMEAESQLMLAFQLSDDEATHSAAYSVLLNVLHKQPFDQQPPVLQAMTHATMRRLIQHTSTATLNGTLVHLVQQVPLMQAADWWCMLQLVKSTGSTQLILKVWNAAVSAATNPELSSLPAFGAQRPDEAWLAQALLRLSSDSRCTSRLQRAFLLPAYNMAVQIFHQPANEKELNERGSMISGGQPAGGLLLHSVCEALAMACERCTNADPKLQHMVLGVLQALVQHPQVGKPSALARMLSAAASAGAAAGDVAVYSTAAQHAKELQLSQEDILRVRSTALQATAQHGITSDDVFKHLCNDALAAAAFAVGTGSQSKPYLSHDAAKTVVNCIESNNSLAGSLLNGSAMPVFVLKQLCEAATIRNFASTVFSLLQYADQHQMLHELPADALAAVLRPAPVGTYGSKVLKQKAFAVLMQQDKLQHVSAPLILQCASISLQQWDEFVRWLHNKCSRTPAAAMHHFLCDLLQASSGQQHADQTWQLFEVLQTCHGRADWLQFQQQLPAALYSTLIEQQAAAGNTQNGGSKVLQLWEIYSNNAGLKTKEDVTDCTALTPAAQEAVVSALVVAGEHAAALQVVQTSHQLVKHLAEGWLQLQLGSVPVQLIGQALCTASRVNSSAAAIAAEKLLAILPQQEWSTPHLALHGQIAVQLVQLLSRHDRLTAAQQLVAECILNKLTPTAAAPAVAAFAKAAARQSRMHDIIKQLFLRPKQQPRDVLLAGLDWALAADDVEAAAMVLYILQQTFSQDGATADHHFAVPDLLSAQQLEQVAKLSCDPEYIGNSSLPSPHRLAQQCVSSSKAVPASVTVSLINALAHEQADLQPARAAVVLGLVTEADLTAVEGGHESSSKHQSADHQPGNTAPNAEVLNQTWLIAQLCYQQLRSSKEDGQDSLLNWVSDLSAEGAAAALFSAWYWAQKFRDIAGASTASGRAMQPALVPPATAVGMLCLQLYDAARAGSKPSLSSLLMDLALLAAAQARQWETGLNVINKAQRVLDNTVGTRTSNTTSGSASKRSGKQQQHFWVPILPAAVAAMPAVLIYSSQQQGLDKMADVLLHDFAERFEQQTEAARAAGQRKQQVHKQSAGYAAHQGPQLLILSVLNSFFTATLDVIQAAHADHDKDASMAAAAAACKVADTVFAPQMVAVQLAARSTSTSSISGGFELPQQQQPLMPDATTYCALCQLYAAAGQHSQAASITLAAVKQQLPLANSSSANSSVETLQTVVAGAAAVWQAADCPGIVTALLDLLICVGVEEIADPLLAAALEGAAATHEEKVLSRLADGEPGFYKLQDLAAKAQATGILADRASSIETVKLHCTEVLNASLLLQELEDSVWQAVPRLGNMR